MKGFNTLVLNEETVKEAVAHYLNDKLYSKHHVEVTSVTYKSPGEYHVNFHDKPVPVETT